MDRVAGSTKAAPDSVVARILDSMEDGVLVVEPGGRIVTCNAAAIRILGLAGTPAAGAGFGEVFLTLEGLDAFTQSVLDAVSGGKDIGDESVWIKVAGEPRTLALATTYLRSGRGGVERGAGIVAVFRDVTEVEALRDAEAELGRKVEAQLAELGDAYRAVEERNEALAATLRKVRVARVVAVGAVLAVLVAAGTWLWKTDISVANFVGADSPAPAAGREPTLLTIEPTALRQMTSVVGRIGPGQVTRMLSPASGTIRAIHFRYGQTVREGARLLDIDMADTLREYRSLRARHIEAVKRVETLAAWENGTPMATARRQLARANDAMEKQRRRVEQTAYLLGEGVIPAAEHEAATEQLDRLREDRAAAARELEVVRARAGPDAREMADLELQNVRDQLTTLQSVMEAATVLAPVDGIVMPPASGARASGPGRGGRLSEGEAVSGGQALVNIADVGTYSVDGAVEEVEVAKLRPGQALRVTGDAFPGIELAGELVEVASHADRATSGAGAKFAIRARLRAPTPEQRQLLRIGMSVDLHIVIRDDPAAITVPLEAIESAPAGPVVRVSDPETGEIRAVAVETGATTPGAVEIVKGLTTGDQVVLPAR